MQEALLAALMRFFECCSGKSRQPFIINEVDLMLRLLAGRRQPKAAAKPNTCCISKKAADLGGRQVRLCPSKAERYTQDEGAPTGAGHYRYFITNRLSRILKTIQKIRGAVQDMIKIIKLWCVKYRSNKTIDAPIDYEISVKLWRKKVLTSSQEHRQLKRPCDFATKS